MILAVCKAAYAIEVLMFMADYMGISGHYIFSREVDTALDLTTAVLFLVLAATYRKVFND